MDPSAKAPQEFEPRFDWAHHEDSHVLIIHLSGFRSNQLKVQVTSTRKLRIGGERRIGGGKLQRFQKEFEVPEDVDTEKVSARFEDGVLYIRQPKRIIASDSHEQTKPKETKPPADSPKVAGGAQSVRENASKSAHDKKPKAQENGKRSITKPKEETKSQTQNKKTPEKSSIAAQPEQETSPKNSIGTETDEKPKPKPKPKSDDSENALQKERELSEEKKEEDEKKKERAVEKKVGERKEEGGEVGDKGSRAEGAAARELTGKLEYKQVVEAMVKQLRSQMGNLALGAVVLAVLCLIFTRKSDVESDL